MPLTVSKQVDFLLRGLPWDGYLGEGNVKFISLASIGELEKKKKKKKRKREVIEILRGSFNIV